MSKVLIWCHNNDEDEFVRKNLTEYLQSCGHQVDECNNEMGSGYEAIYYIASNESEFVEEEIQVAMRCAPKIVLINPTLGITETDFVPKSTRDCAAILAEMLLKVSGHNYTIVRLPCDLIGAKYMHNGILRDYIISCLSMKKLSVVENSVAQITSIESILPMLEKIGTSDLGNGQTYNLGNSEVTKLMYLANLVIRAGQLRGFKTFVDTIYKEPTNEIIDFTKAEIELGWKDTTDIYSVVEEAFSRFENGDDV